MSDDDGGGAPAAPSATTRALARPRSDDGEDGGHRGSAFYHDGRLYVVGPSDGDGDGRRGDRRVR